MTLFDGEHIGVPCLFLFYAYTDIGEITIRRERKYGYAEATSNGSGQMPDWYV